MTCFDDGRGLPLRNPPSGGSGEDMAQRAPGRPKDLEKREAILDAAQSLFAQRGVDGAPIEAIAAQSGVSKVTVYAHFGDKGKIFEALVQRETERLTRELARTTSDATTLEERLVNFGIALVQVMTEPCHLALDKALSLEAQRNPALGRRFYEAGPGHVCAMLSDLIARATAAGECSTGDPDRAARDLMALWLGFTAIERRFCGGCLPDVDVLTAHIRRTTQLYLRSCATP